MSLTSACTDSNRSLRKSDEDLGAGDAAVADAAGAGGRDRPAPGTGGEPGSGGDGGDPAGGGNVGGGQGGTGGGHGGAGGHGPKPDPDAGSGASGGVGAGGMGSGGTGSGGSVGPVGGVASGGVASGGAGPGGGLGEGGEPGPVGGAGTGGSVGTGGSAGPGGGLATGGMGAGGAAAGGSVGVGGSGAGGDPGPGGGLPIGGGVAMGGDPGLGGGIGQGGEEPPPPPPPPVCDDPPCAWPEQGEWAPAARMTYFNVPDDAAAATRLGCELLGVHNGTALANARGLPIVDEGDLSIYFQPDANGDIPAILLGRLAGADTGEVFGATGPVDFQFFQGFRAGPDFRINRASLIPNTQSPIVHFPNTAIAADGALTVPTNQFSMLIPVFGQVAVGVTLEHATAKGFVTLPADEIGFDLPVGTIEGYLTREAVIRDWIQPLQAICFAGVPLAVCGAVGNVIGPPGTCNDANCLGADLVAATLGSWEVHVDAAGPRVCNGRIPGDCNAVGVCFETRMDGVAIVGVSP